MEWTLNLIEDLEWKSVPTPCFLLLEQVLERNCRKMLNTAKALNIEIRAHTKTHKTM